MLKRNLWKILLTLVLLGWALWELTPIKDAPSFATYVKDHATAKKADLNKLVDDAVALQKSGKTISEFTGIRQLVHDRRYDLAASFPGINVGDVKNLDRRNNILLDYLFKQSKSKLQKGLDLAGGVSVILEVDEKALAKLDSDYARQQKLDKAIEILTNRVNQFGVAEPIIRPIGNNRIEVQVAGLDVTNNPDVVDSIKKPARLDFRLVHPDLRPATQPPADVPPGYEVLSHDEEDNKSGEAYSLFYVVKVRPEMSGENVETAGVTTGQFGDYQVHLSFNKTGAKQFGDVTTANVGRLLGIVLDGKLYSAPRINEPITGGSAQITGRFSAREAERLASVLNNPLDVPLVVRQQNIVGPSLAQDAITSGVKATWVGVGLVALFMIGYYTIAGLVAVISVIVNITILLAVLASLGATMTMPGIAGIVLTVGMAVDAHILIFERMREELKAGKSLVAAFHAGHDKAFTTIVDANLTTLIASVLMIVFGTGPVKGFGVTLTIGIFTTMFTALIVSEMLLDMLIVSGVMKKMIMLHLPAPNINFVKYGRRAFIASWVLVFIGVGALIYKGRSVYGIDFAGGDSIVMSFKQKIDPAKLRHATDAAKLGEVNPLYQSELGGTRETLNIQAETGKGKQAAAVLTKAFPEAKFEVVGETTIGPSIGKEIQWNATKSVFLSILGIMLYVAFRFEIGYGIGAVVSTVHDLFMTMGIFVLTERQFSAGMVGAILLIVGYSINDTIVVFDRIREELKANPTMTLRDVINMATNRVFTRSILTSLTTFLAALALYLFGGGVINDLSFTFLVGIVTGTFSSIFIASPIFYWWHKGDRKHVEAHHDIAPKYEWQGTSKAAE